MRKVVVNSTPIIVLCNAGCFDLLHKLYGEISVPRAVYREVTFKEDSACRVLLDMPEWVKVCEVEKPADARLLSSRLHAGEVEVIELARSIAADLVVMDDRAAKKTAEYLRLAVTGTLGVLVRGKEQGYLPAVAPVLERIKAQGFYIGEPIEQMVLKAADEL